MSVARLIRKRLPAAWQPPVRFLYERARGLLEREMSLVASVVRRGDRVADVGANNGLYTHVLAKRGAFVEAFEPQPECVAVLRAYASRRPLRNVRVHPVALSATTGVAALHLPPGSAASPSASLRATPGSDATLDVALESLDAFEFVDLRLMKIDVEGAELDVLRGAAETLRRCRPLLFVEIEQRHHREPITEVFQQVASLGYDGAFLDAAGRLRPLPSFDVARWQGAEARRPDHAEPYINNFFFSPTAPEARRWPT
ncbi:MAG TPA: FkbM family methyltransferase [Gemmatimonadaceae bacterium]